MNRWKMRGAAALAIIALAVAGCQEQGPNDDLDNLDTSPSMDMTVPSQSDGMTEGSFEASPSEEASPDES